MLIKTSHIFELFDKNVCSFYISTSKCSFQSIDKVNVIVEFGYHIKIIHNIINIQVINLIKTFDAHNLFLSPIIFPNFQPPQFLCLKLVVSHNIYQVEISFQLQLQILSLVPKLDSNAIIYSKLTYNIMVTSYNI